jgi:medium-chain acyl-[acyl-carrier-protein] hydrolase
MSCASTAVTGGLRSVERARWLAFHKPRTGPQVRLFCFPHAGGGASTYRLWARAVSPAIEICPVQLPGRENRIDDPPVTRLRPLVQAIAAVVAEHLDLPYAFFGHSYGGLLGFETARELRRRGKPLPVVLFASGHRAPQLPARRLGIRGEPDESLVLRLRELDGTPPGVLESRDVLEHVLPALKADFVVCDEYVYLAERPLECPIVALGGSGDRMISPDDLDAWREQTAAGFELQLFDGDHFYVLTQPLRVAAAVSARLLPALRSSG